MTSDIIEMIKDRDDYLYKFRKFGLSDDYKNFSILRNKVQRQIKSAKTEYFSNQIEEDKDDPKKLWKHLKNIGLNGKKEEGNICLNINGEVCHEAKSVANHFNDFFYKYSFYSC